MKRIFLLCLHAIVGLNAIGGGYYGMSGAPNVPLEWLKGSPFNNYFVPSLILLVAVGGSHILAFILTALKRSQAKKSSVLAGTALLVWILAQVLIIGYVSWLQPAMFLIAIVILWIIFADRNSPD